LIAAREAFGPSLKAERERQGITLQAIAHSTKISVSLLAALERNDVAQWPKGIFRRAFVREYAAAIGLPPGEVVSEFGRFFPEEPVPELPDTASALRLTLEIDPRTNRLAAIRRVLVAMIELSAVLLLGAVAAWLFEADLMIAAGVVGLLYYPVANACLERKLRVQTLSWVGRHAFDWTRRRSRRSARATRHVQQDLTNDMAPASELRVASN
jgi:transcriptional regulator with XRE-family HTH domain